MSPSEVMERPAPGRITTKGRGAMRGIRLKLTAPGRFAALRDAALSASLWAGIPALVAGVYLFGFAADQYQSESKFVVRGDTLAVGAEASGTLGDIIELNTSQDTRLAADYLASGALLGDLAKTIDLSATFTAPGLDLFGGLSPDASAEAKADYWQAMASADVDSVSGIVTLHTRAFSAADALALNTAAIAAAEAKLNELHLLTLEGAADVAARRAADAAERLKQARLDIKVFRERYRAVDLRAGASSTFELLSQLRQLRIQDRADLAVMRAQGAGASPQVKALESRIAATDRQIVELRQQLTGALEGDDGAASAAIEAYDRLLLRQDMASQYVARTEAALTRADRRLSKRSVYLEVFVPPAAASEATFPRRSAMTLTVFLIALAVWALARLVWAGIRSHEV
ncbi:MAG: hypothetical protein QM698_16425 [Micropepsaceae bacterium]